MPGKDTVFDSKVKYKGIFNFPEFYKFCYQYIIEELQMDFLAEKEYQEKISGMAKEVKIKWEGERKLTDYFQFDLKIEFHIIAMTEVELNQGGTKIKTNKGDMKITIKGIFVKDYEGKYDVTAFKQFLRGVYEKFIIPSRIKEFEDKISGYCDDFASQAKAWLDLEGKK
jgi:hypothetical protein